MHALFGTLGSDCLPVFEQLLSHFVKLLVSSRFIPDERRRAYTGLTASAKLELHPNGLPCWAAQAISNGVLVNSWHRVYSDSISVILSK